jgi:peptide deformylase
MAIKEIARIGEPILRQKTRDLTLEEIKSDKTQNFIDDLIETMRAANGAGLAANQIFSSLRICAIEVHNNPRYPYKPNIPLSILINPKIETVGNDVFENYEGCLSVPDLRGRVQRYCQMKLKYYNRDGESISQKIKGISAGTYQHEIDHLDGKLFIDRVLDPKSLCTWETFKKYHERDVANEVKTIVARWGS